MMSYVCGMFFWVDGRSRAVYKSFHDVITFDTIYLTNKYDMSFALLLELIIMVNLLYLVVGYCPVKIRIRLFGYLGNGYKVCVALLQKPLSQTNAK